MVAHAMGPEEDLVAERLARGCRCFAAWNGDELVGYGWLSRGPEWIGELELQISPGAGEAYIWNCVTLLEHRRKGVFRTLLVGVVAQARREGLSRLWVGSLAIPAEKAMRPSGFQPTLHLDSTVVRGMRWLRVKEAGGATPGLVEAARTVLSVGGRPIRIGTSIRLSRPRRH